jgi:hypothetical protein
VLRVMQTPCQFWRSVGYQQLKWLTRACAAWLM